MHLLDSSYKNRYLKYLFRFGGPILLIIALIFYWLLKDDPSYSETVKPLHILIWLKKKIGLNWLIGILVAASFGWFIISIQHWRLKKSGKTSDGLNPNGRPNIWC